MNSDRKVNTMTPAFVAKQDLFTQPINIGAQKIDSSPLTMYDIVVTGFSFQNS